MFRLNLKALMQLSKSEEGALVRHTRIDCDKWSYLVCYALQDGCLTIQQARRIRSGCTVSGWKRLQCRRRPRQYRFSQKWLQSYRYFSCTRLGHTSVRETHVPGFVDIASQTPAPCQVQAGVHTEDLYSLVSRCQQTNTVYLNSTRCQTRCPKLEVHSTQTELELKTRSTQAVIKPILTSVSCTQTMAILMPQDRHTQTTYAEDVEELLRPHDKLFHLILRSMTSQSNLLIRGVESINQLVDFKQLELEKERLDAKAQAAARQLKLSQLQARRAHKRPKCKIRCRPTAKRDTEQQQPQLDLQLQAETQTEVTPTDCRGTQTEHLKPSLVSFSEAATQTDRVKGFFRLRQSS